MKFLITVVVDFLGEHLIDRLLQDGHEVVLIGRSAKDGAEAKDYIFVEAVITDITSLKRVQKASPTYKPSLYGCIGAQK